MCKSRKVPEVSSEFFLNFLLGPSCGKSGKEPA